MFPAKIIAPVAVSVLGLVAGFIAKDSTFPGITEADRLVAKARKILQRDLSPKVSPVNTYTPVGVSSTDTLETIVEKGEAASFNDLAKWFLTASSEEMTAYWASCREIKPHLYFTSLVFMNWGRIDPGGAIKATAGTKHEGMAWWGWAANDPEAAIAAADPEFHKRVYNAIGQHHPQWVRDHFDEIPGDLRNMVLNGFTTWKEDSDHLARLDFLVEHGRDFHGSSFKTLVRKDPWDAYDWLQENGRFVSDDWRDGPADILMKTMAEEYPEDLERLAAMTPSGQVKWKMNDLIFEELLSSDQEAALQFAKKIETPLIASKRLAQIGSQLLESDPERAFDLASEILGKTPDQLDPRTEVTTGSYSNDSDSNDKETTDFIEALAAKDRERIMEMVAIASDSHSLTFNNLASNWAKQDLDNYSSWVAGQEDPEVYKSGASFVVNELTGKGRFEEASEWALSGFDRKNPGTIYTMVYSWNRVDPDRAREWLESSEIENGLRTNLREMLERNR